MKMLFDLSFQLIFLNSASARYQLWLIMEEQKKKKKKMLWLKFQKFNVRVYISILKVCLQVNLLLESSNHKFLINDFALWKTKNPFNINLDQTLEEIEKEFIKKVNFD